MIPIRATLSHGSIACTVRATRPLTQDEWAIVAKLAAAVEETAELLGDIDAEPQR